MSNPPTERLNDSMEEKKNVKNKKNNGKLQKQPSNEEKFDGPGVSFKGKLIGFESVSESKGERMCQVAMAKLKAAVIALGVHKEKITINLSLEGITLYDDKMEDQLYRHLIEKISFVSRDASDSRAFGYVFNEDDEKYRFCAIKTEKSAEPVMATLKELFKAYYEKQEEKSGNDSTSQTEESADQMSTAAQPSDGATTPAASNAAADSVLLENKITPMESFESSENNLISVEADIFSLNISSGPTSQQLSLPASPPMFSNQLQAALANTSFATQQIPPPRLPPPPPPSHFGQPHAMTSPFSGATVRAVMTNNQVSFPGQFGSPAIAQQALPQLNNQNSLFQQPQQFFNTPFSPQQQSNNGWTAFDSNQQLMVNNNPTNQSNPFAAALPFSSPQQLQQQQPHHHQQQHHQLHPAPLQPHQTVARPTSSGVDLLSDSGKTSAYDPFGDLAILTKANPHTKKPSKDDFVKEPAKPSLHSLATHQHDNQHFLPIQPTQPQAFNDFNLDIFG